MSIASGILQAVQVSLSGGSWKEVEFISQLYVIHYGQKEKREREDKEKGIEIEWWVKGIGLEEMAPLSWLQLQGEQDSANSIQEEQEWGMRKQTCSSK